MGYLDLEKDVNGWHIFVPSIDSRIMYVSNEGNDGTGVVYGDGDFTNPFEPSGEMAFATFAAAIANSRDGYPDWVLVRRGDTIEESLGWGLIEGRGASEPSLIAAYGITGLSPIIKTGNDLGIRRFSRGWMAMSGIELYSNGRDPDSLDYVDNTGGIGFFIYTGDAQTVAEGILLEAVRMKFFTDNLVLSSAVGTLDGVHLYRSVALDSYNSVGHSQGLSAHGVDNLKIEECNFDHNGWYSQVGTGDGREATIFNHNSYVTDSTEVKALNNIFTQSSSIQFKVKNHTTGIGVGYEARGNLVIGGEIAWEFGAPDEHAELSTVNPIVDGNVWCNAGYGNPTGRGVAWFFDTFNTDNHEFTNNYMLRSDPLADNILFYAQSFGGINGLVKSNTVFGVDDTGNGASSMILIGSEEGGNAPFSGFEISENVFDVLSCNIAKVNRANTIGFSFADNNYSSTNTEDTWFTINSVVKTDAEWVSETGDTSTFTQRIFIDNTRSIETYMATLGETETIAAFIEKCREQDKYAWDTDYTAEVVVPWLKAGFTEVIVIVTFHKAGDWRANNKYKFLEIASLIEADLLANAAGDGPYLYTAGGAAIAFSWTELKEGGVFNVNQQYYMCERRGIYTYRIRLSSPNHLEAKEFCATYDNPVFGGDDIVFGGDTLIW